MGKGKRERAIFVISSEDEEDGDFSVKTKSRISKSAPTRKNPKRVKRVSLSSSCSRPFQGSDSSGFDEVKRFCEEFDQGFTQFKVSSGSRNNKELWVDKYKPRSLEELAVHKKKIDEVKMWFEERVRNSGDISNSNVILISGQAGFGKSATVHAIASHLGAEVCEWNTPTPTIWQDYQHASSSGIRYMSKLEEFENFVERIRKYGLVSSSLTRTTSIIILIDDLPLVNGRVSYGRLQRCLHLLLQSVRLPTAILFNDYGKSDSAEQHTRYSEELQLSLQNAGAFKVTFNPITVNSIRKVLKKICSMELFEVSDEQIDLIAKASAGDIRHAITSLQYFCLVPHQSYSSSVRKGPSTYLEEEGGGICYLDDGLCLSFGKDATLSLFHALGKFLHNKRENGDLMVPGENAMLLKDKYFRYPLKMDAPELVLSQAHGQARLVTDFLHENVLDFLNEEAIEDACVVTTYLSDSDLLLSSLSGTLSRNFEAENVIQSAAASIAARGVLFGNSNPVSSRWHAIRKPKLWQVEQSLRHNKSDMENRIRDVHSCLKVKNLHIVPTEFRLEISKGHYRLLNEADTAGNNFDGMDLDDETNETDDEIEDW